MSKKLFVTIFGRRENIVIDKVDVLEEFRKSIVEERLYGRPYYKPLFSEMGHRRMIQSGQKYMRIEITAKKKDGTAMARTYEIPFYCAYGIIDKMKKLEGCEISVHMRKQLPRRLPYMDL